MADALRKGNFEVTLHRTTGKLITGTVTDDHGTPVDHAKLVIARDRYESEKPTTISDDNGNFEFNNVDNKWETYITATAPGLAPAQVKLQASGTSDSKLNKSIEIQMKPPTPFEGTIVDKDGKPINGVTIQIEQWNNNRALEWSTHTDRKGHFIWADGTADPFSINAYKKNYTNLDQVLVTPGKPVRLTMNPPVDVSGNVFDADTKAPIPAFTITYGNRWTSQEDVTWQTGSARKLGDGKYSAEISQFCNGGKLKVEAKGYLPAISRMIMSDEGAIVIDFALKKGVGPSGIAVRADGTPASGISVCCLLADNGVNVQLGRTCRIAWMWKL